MQEVISQIAAEFRALGWHCIIHGPEVWLLIAKIAAVLGLFDGGVLCGMWLAALFGANGRDDDE